MGNAISQFFCETAQLACNGLKKYCNTLKALCCYSGHREQEPYRGSNKIEF